MTSVRYYRKERIKDMTTTHGEKSINAVDYGREYDYIFDRIDPVLVRSFAKLNDEALKLTLYAYFCDLAQGSARIPKKKAKTKIAEILIRQGKNFKKVAELTGIGRSTFYKLGGKNER